MDIWGCVCCASMDLRETGVWSKDFDVKFLRCSSCGHIQLASFPTDKQLKEFYDGFSFGRELSAKLLQAYRKRASAQFDYVMRYSGYTGANKNTQAISVCDIGCGYGILLEAFRGISEHLRGYEVDEKCLRYAADTLGVKLESPPSDWHAIGFHDIVLMSHYLEHERGPAGLIKAFHKNGCKFVFVEVPSILCFTYGVLDKGHIHYFSEESLSKLLSSNGYEVLNSGLYGGDAFSRSNFWRRLSVKLWTLLLRQNPYITENPKGVWLRALAKIDPKT